MPIFPSLSTPPVIQGFSEEVAFDPTIRSSYEGGYILTRARFTRITKRYKVCYRFLTLSEKETLSNFEKEVRVGSESFTWNHPITGQAKTVRLARPIIYRPVLRKDYWEAELELEEV